MSSYRDERAALQERVGVLEEDLREARSKAEQVDALGKDVADKQKEVDKLRAKLAKYEAPPQPGRKGPAVAMVAVGALFVVGAATAFLVAKPAAAPPLGAAPAVAPEDQLPEPCEAYFREIEACVEKHPEMAQLRQAAVQQRAAFKNGLSAPAAHDAILGACEQSMKALEESCK